MPRSTPPTRSALAQKIHTAAHPVAGRDADYDPLLAIAAGAEVVLLGEASHGTHEFYRERARITRRLVDEHGFAAVAVEADWPDAQRVNSFVRGAGADASADEALAGFRRFPQWMWRNHDVLEFVTWLRARNEAAGEDAAAGFYGIDLYSLYGSIEAVLRYLQEVDPDAARRARYRYACFDHHGDEPQAYGYAASFGLTQSCEEEAVRQLVEMSVAQAHAHAASGGRGGAEARFSAEQNARLVKNAEEYYRSMFRGRVSSWNLRDQHMAETLDSIAAHLRRLRREPKVVVWAHNSHLGDARATEMAEEGELNVGQLVRERYGERAVVVGFTTYTGTVTAASEWDGPAERKRVTPALPDSYEALFHDVGTSHFLLDLRAPGPVADALREPLLERAIGVVYRPDTERVSHYFHARLADQFDAVVHLDATSAVRPLERAGVAAGRDEPPETYPSGM